MSSYNNIHSPRFQIFQNPFDIRTLLHPADILHPTRHSLQTLFKSIVMLISQHGRRHKYRHLLTVCDRLKCRPDSDFRFPEADIPAHQTIHNVRFLHILLHRLNRLHLVGSLLVHERSLQFILQKTVF